MHITLGGIMVVRLKIFWILTVLVMVFLMLIGCHNNQDYPLDLKQQDESSTIIENQKIHDSESEDGCSYGEIIYVPIYSSIFHYKDLRTYELSATLSIHNIDMEKPIKVTKVDYYNTDGELIKNFAKDSLELKPFQTVHFVIEEDDTSGGTGANFLVEWVSDSEVCSPLVEAVMISTSGQQGISFTTTGKVIKTYSNK